MDMELPSEEALEAQLITNGSFFDVGTAPSLQYGDYSLQMYHHHTLEPQTPRPQGPAHLTARSQAYRPLTCKSQTRELPVSQSPQFHEPLTTKPVNYANSVVNFMRLLFPITSEDIASERFSGLTARIVSILKNSNDDETEELRSGLNGHVGLYEDGYPWVDLEAAYLLNLKYDMLWKPNVFRPNHIKICPRMNLSLQDARYVPMQHILHCLAIFHFQPELTNYPYEITEPVPLDFVRKIRRNDVIRGANVHCLLMGLKFPLVAVQFPCLIEELWDFLFIKKFSAMAGIELYNGFFFHYSRNLGQGIVLPLDHIPSHIKESVSAKFMSK